MRKYTVWAVKAKDKYTNNEWRIVSTHKNKRAAEYAALDMGLTKYKIVRHVWRQ